MHTHYTINKDWHHPDARPYRADQIVYVPGHSVGDITRHVVELGPDDTADNPASTKDVLRGPAFIVYDHYVDGGTNTVIFENAKDFYATFKIDVPWEDIRQLIDHNWEEATRDYAALADAGDIVDGHIYETLLRLSFWHAGSKGA